MRLGKYNIYANRKRRLKNSASQKKTNKFKYLTNRKKIINTPFYRKWLYLNQKNVQFLSVVGRKVTCGDQDLGIGSPLTLINWAVMLTAISSGVSELISIPMGA